jgi:hypothetical protein
MSTDTRLPETTEQDLLDFLEIIKATPLRTMREIRADKGVTGKQTDTVPIPAVRSGPKHLAPYRGPRFWRHPVAWFTWNYDWLIYWGLNEQNRHRSHRVV